MATLLLSDACADRASRVETNLRLEPPKKKKTTEVPFDIALEVATWSYVGRWLIEGNFSACFIWKGKQGKYNPK